MAGEELSVIQLKNDFYRDGFQKVILALLMVLVVIALFIALSLYLFLTKPAPVYFETDKEWRVLKPVPLDQPYLAVSDLLQWTTESLAKAFTYDYISYNQTLERNKHFFTPNGLEKYQSILNKYAPSTLISSSKTFVNGVADGAPFILNQGLLPSNVYAWWIQMPFKLQFSGYQRTYSQTFTLQIFVIRTPTLNNINGVTIDNLIIVSDNKPASIPGRANG